jgi:biopolymer transport protein ExbD|tara:strand:+ start:81 stop:497 length:417 start_codon:yes stop_codon:yes gene_type:complete
MRIRTTDNESGELINISSMIDVMFILIIFFLVTTTFKEEEVDHLVNLPVESRNQSLTQTAGNLIKINIRENGSYVVMGQQITEEALSKWMGAEVDKKPELKVLIRCDADSKHLYLANVMSICRHTGVPKMNIAVRTEK